MQPVIIRSWFQLSSGRRGVRRDAQQPTGDAHLLLEVEPGAAGLVRRAASGPTPSRSPARLVSEQRPARAARRAAQVEGVGQRRAAQHPRVVVGDLGDRPDLRPPLGVALEVGSTGCTARPARHASSCRGRSTPRLTARSSPGRAGAPCARGPAPPAAVRPRRSSSSRSRTASTCSVSPVTASARIAWRPHPRQLVVDSAAAPSPAPADLVAGGDLEAHLGRPPVLVGEPGDDRGRSRSRPTRRAARGHPRCAASSRPRRRGRGRSPGPDQSRPVR